MKMGVAIFALACATEFGAVMPLPLAQCRQAFGYFLTVKTAGTCPSGMTVLVGSELDVLLDFEAQQESLCPVCIPLMAGIMSHIV